EIERLISIDELDTGSGVNQIGTLQWAGDTRWSSHFRSVSSLLRLYDPTCTVLSKIVDLYIATIDSQLQELNIRFNEHVVELIILSSALNPKDGYRSFDCDKINLVEKFYPLDFTDQEKILFKCQLQHYQFDVINHPDMQNLCTIAGLCRKLVETGKSEIYYLIDRFLRLVLALPVCTATTERAFSVMKIIKTRLRSKMEDNFLTNCLVVYIEQAIAKKISVDKIIDDFYDMK
ncbi:LOW QUALITY PROTEIN: Dimer_Tnp_hAT domain-containing protein, partial [Cephalotus follicularis]